MSKKIFIATGEASGDLHASNLVKSLKARDPLLQFEGIGSQKMREAGVDLIVDSKTLSFLGVFEVLFHLKTIFSTLRFARNHLRQSKPDLLIIVDFAGFNLRLAKTAKQLGIKVLFYISPKIWAWRYSRIKVIKRRIDMMAVIFPFETQYYHQENIPVRYVGNPLCGQVKPALDKAQAQQQFGLDANKPIVALLPGSRKAEVRYMFADMLKAAALLKAKHPELQFILPIASTLSKQDFEPYLADSKVDVKFIDGQAYDVLSVSDACIVVSGTATLETALMGVPMVVIYRGDRLSVEIVKRLIKVNYIGLCNLIAPNPPVAKELIQEEASAENIAEETAQLLFNNEYNGKIKKDLAEIKQILEGDKNTSDLASLVFEMLEGS